MAQQVQRARPLVAPPVHLLPNHQRYQARVSTREWIHTDPPAVAAGSADEVEDLGMEMRDPRAT